jgi:hypothetical protein
MTSLRAQNGCAPASYSSGLDYNCALVSAQRLNKFGVEFLEMPRQWQGPVKDRTDMAHHVIPATEAWEATEASEDRGHQLQEPEK